MTLYCDKSGRNWPCASVSEAQEMAVVFGLTAWTYCPGATVPPTMSATIAEMQRRPRHPVTRGIE